MKLIVIVCLGLIAVLAAACGGDEPVLLTPTPTPTESPATPTPTPAVPTYNVWGFVLSTSNNLLWGGEVTLQPSGFSAITDEDGFYVIEGVPDGEYDVSIAPHCLEHGCYGPVVLVVDGADVPEFSFAPVPASVLPRGPVLARSVLDCFMPLNQVEMPASLLILVGPNDLQPGESAQIVLASPECFRCAGLLKVDAPVGWSIEPGDGVGINPETGVLSIFESAATGAHFTVTADVGNGQYSASAEVHVYSAAQNPLVGVWKETGAGNISQLLLTSGGEFAVTLNPYEHYQDYWGNYTYDLSTGFIELTASAANQTAPKAEGTGTFTIDANGKLTLKDICLGQWDSQNQAPAANCGHEFEK